MKLSAQDEYGLRCLLRLARQPDGPSLTIPEISQAEGISHHNVAKYLGVLRREGFVESERGQRGGYTLARPPEKIVVGEVLACLGGRLFDPAFCDHHTGVAKTCQHSSVACAVRTLWIQVQNAVDQVLGATTLRDMMAQMTVHDAGHRSAGPTELLQVAAPD